MNGSSVQYHNKVKGKDEDGAVGGGPYPSVHPESCLEFVYRLGVAFQRSVVAELLSDYFNRK